MAGLGRIAVVSICVLLVLPSSNGLETVNGRIKLTMGTTSGCGNALNFITNQLVPTYAIYHEYMDVDFVPWGRTVRNPDNSMTCQFGPNDCWANRLHRCVMNFLGGNTMAKVRYYSCEFTPPYPSFGQLSYECALAAGISRQAAEFCVNNPQFDTLDQQAQAAAAEPMRIIDWVPFVVFNDVIDVQAHNEAHVRLQSMVCQALANDPNVPVRSC